jgi:hypothetical protein
MIQSLSVAMVASMLLGQVQNPHFDQLKYFHNRSGTWKAEGTMGGEPIDGRVTYDWILNRNALQAVWDFRVGDGPRNLSLEVIAWDARDQVAKSWTFSADGANWSNVFALGSKTAGIRVDGVNGEGERMTATGISREVGDDEWEILAVIPRGRSGEQGEYSARVKRDAQEEIDISASECSVPQLMGLQPFRWRMAME